VDLRSVTNKPTPLGVRARRTRNMSRVIVCRWHVRLVTEHDGKSVHGRAASVRRLLAEGEDYSDDEGNVNGYF
jgi:hypothetical protein